MPTLAELRSNLDLFQRELLDAIAEQYLATEKGPIARSLHLTHGKEKVIAALKAIGGSAVHEVEDYQNGNRYEPSFLGILLTSSGPVYQGRLSLYVNYAEKTVRDKPTQNLIWAQDVAKALTVLPPELPLLYKLLTRSHLNGRSSQISGDGNWQVGIFEEVDELARWPDRQDFIEHVAFKGYDPDRPVLVADTRGYSQGSPLPTISVPRLPFQKTPTLPQSPSTSLTFDYEPDFEKLVSFVSELKSHSTAPFRLVRHSKGFKRKEDLLSADALQKELPDMVKLDLDFFYKPGNPDIGGWASVDLDFEKKSADVRCLGDFDWFRPKLTACIDRLGLRKSAATKLAEFNQKAEASLSPALYGYIMGSLRDGNFSGALSSAVVYIEDRLRTKLNQPGNQMAGADLVTYAFKNPGVLTPPLAHAGNPEDNAFLLIRGWFGLVRNLHGHQASMPITLDEAFAQLAGANYVLWLIENSTGRTP